MSTPLARVGFVGIGRMGAPMAARLYAAGYPLVAHDARADAATAFAAAHPGVEPAATVDPLAACDVVITMLPDSAAVEAVVLGREQGPGLMRLMRKGALLIDMSSSAPLRTQALAAQLHDAGHDFLDAPVSGGVKRALDGTLAIMVGGEPAVFHAHRALLACMGRTITHVGPAGCGHAMKALNNYVSAAGLVATVEALHAGRRFGLDPALMTDVLNGSTGRNNTTENKVKPFMLSGRYDSGFALALMAKDLGLAMTLGAQVGSPMRLGEAVRAMWDEAAAALPATADHTEMHRWLAAGRD
ncbi:MAG TPA: NAD(P)-dependent oxidoreductase [Burkholderiaceae bacterium]|nr:NAD(P)-dependent oxidoreductase [Burkholderiaceae bacterium]